MADFKKVTGGGIGFVAGAVASIATARSSMPKPPDPPPLWDTLVYIAGLHDWIATAGALFAFIAAAFSMWEVFKPDPATPQDVRDAVTDDGAVTRDHVDSGMAAVRADIARDKHEQALQDIIAGTASPELLKRYRAALAIERADGGSVSDREAAQFALTADEASRSDDPREREIAALIDEGRVMEASERKAELAEERAREAMKPVAREMREAGWLALPQSPSRALEYFRRATQLDPTDVWSWIELGRLCRDYEGTDAARRCFDAALQYVVSERDRSALEQEIGDIEMALGNLGAARARHMASLAIRERLAELEPGNCEWQRNLSVSYDRLGDVEVSSGNLGAARDRYTAGLAIAERLAELDSGHSLWQRDLSISYNRLGNVEVSSGNLDAARDRYTAGLAIAERLAELEPGNCEWQRDLSISYEKLGYVEVSSGDLSAARDRYMASLTIRERLAELEPGNSAWQRNLSVVYEKLGDLEASSGNLGAARERYMAILTIRERLAELDPCHSLWQRDLSVSYDRLGNLEASSGNLGAAQDRYMASLAIRERLAELEPGNSEWQRDLFISHAKLAQLAEAEGTTANAIAEFSAAEAIIARLAGQWPDHPGFAADLEQVRVRLDRLRG